MNYCATCVLPNTRPGIYFDAEGRNCNCASAQIKNEINWAEREKAFEAIVAEAKKKSARYDCVIPVSGGKDSTWQVVKALSYELNPLCVTWKTPGRTLVGQRNLENLVSLGVNHIDFSVNPKVEKRFTLKSFELYGSPVIPMHMALHAIPMQIADSFDIPLIIWGENSAFEYGSSRADLKGAELTKDWLVSFGVTHGTTAEDWYQHGFSEAEMAPYQWPIDSLKDRTRAVFMGQFFRWDPVEAYRVASSFGFQTAQAPKTGYYKFADIDEDFLMSIHHWLKWLKFGFTRTWDNLSLEIRNGRISRQDAIKIIQEKGDETPFEEIAKFCEFVGISEKHFWAVAESFRNRGIWNFNAESQVWQIEGFLIDSWKWKDEA